MSTLPKGITRDDAEHGELYFAEAQMRFAVLQAEALRARVAELEAKLAEAEKDAARYRWLRSVPNAFKAQRIVNDTPEGMDAAIDAAIAAKEQP